MNEDLRDNVKAGCEMHDTVLRRHSRTLLQTRACTGGDMHSGSLESDQLVRDEARLIQPQTVDWKCP